MILFYSGHAKMLIDVSVWWLTKERGSRIWYVMVMRKKDTFKNVDTVVEHPSVHNSHDLQLWWWLQELQNNTLQWFLIHMTHSSSILLIWPKRSFRLVSWSSCLLYDWFIGVLWLHLHLPFPIMNPAEPMSQQNSRIHPMCDHRR